MTPTYCMACTMLAETEKACQLRWYDPDLEADATFWIPKSCLDPDEFDLSSSLHLMRVRASAEYTNIDIQSWWLRLQDWFEPWLDELEDEDE